ncbi:transcriptional regulator TbsP domain-containing protein [Halosegnis marinus]|uniref:DUF5821 family protein n=1 Tax=Halosegnis marinus TaxID=3034023 RepID=A0ABD5ZTU4_9EURY|nr:DUF5821 family protein [Halosegnis sp. DT85]
MSEEVSAGQLSTVLRDALAGGGAATVTCTDATVLFAAVRALDALDGSDRPDETRLLATDGAAKAASRDFVTATAFADLRADDAAALRTVDPAALPEPMVVTDESVVPVLRGVPCKSVTVRVADTTLRSEYTDALSTRWDDAEGYDLDSYPRSDFLASLSDKFGDAFRADFERALAAPDTRGPGDGVDPVDLLVLVAAKHGEQSYELNRWGESFGVASVGKFSQSKRRLEEIGLVETEKVQTGSVGRPRQRLRIGLDDLAGADAEELVGAMRSVLG